MVQIDSWEWGLEQGRIGVGNMRFDPDGIVVVGPFLIRRMQRHREHRTLPVEVVLHGRSLDPFGDHAKVSGVE